MHVHKNPGLSETSVPLNPMVAHHSPMTWLGGSPGYSAVQETQGILHGNLLWCQALGLDCIETDILPRETTTTTTTAIAITARTATTTTTSTASTPTTKKKTTRTTRTTTTTWLLASEHQAPFFIGQCVQQFWSCSPENGDFMAIPGVYPIDRPKHITNISEDTSVTPVLVGKTCRKDQQFPGQVFTNQNAPWIPIDPTVPAISYYRVFDSIDIVWYRF